MTHTQTINQAIDAPASKSTTLVRLSGALLLLLQAALLLGLSWYSVQFFESTCNGQAVSFMEALNCESGSEEEMLAVGRVSLFLFIYVPVALLAVVAAIAFLFLRGWLLALGVQGLSLFLALLFFSALPPYAHVAMLASIFMVLYLNSYNVRAAFDRRGGS